MLGLGLSIPEIAVRQSGVGAGAHFQQESTNNISGQSDAGGLDWLDAPIGGTPGGDKVLTLVSNGGGTSSRVSLNFVAVSGAANWTPGTYTFPINIKSKSDVITLASVFLYRAGSPVQEWDPAIVLSTGVNTISLVSSSTYSGDPNDLIYFQFLFTANAAAINHTFTLTADQGIITPWAAGSVIPAAPTLTLISSASDNQPDFDLTGDVVTGDRVDVYAYSDAGLTTLESSGFGVVASDGSITVTNQLGPLSDGQTWFIAKTTRGGRQSSASNTVSETIDTVAPTLSSPTGTQTGQTTANLSVSTNEGNGTAWVVVVASGDTAPSAAQIMAGHNHAGTAAFFASSAFVVATGAQPFSATGLSAGTGYKAHYVQQDNAGNISSVSSSATFTTASAYTGPGDAVAGALGGYGLSAFTSALIGTKAVRLRESGGNTEQDFLSIAGGGLDLTAIATFKGANNLFVVKLYDQVGSVGDLVQATTGLQPAFTLNGIGSLPILDFAGAKFLRTATSTLTLAQPFTIAGVMAAGATDNFVYLAAVGPIGIVAKTTNILCMLASGFAANVTAAAGTLHGVHAAFNDTSSVLYINGTGNAQSPGATGVSSQYFEFGDGSETGTGFEIGLWPFAFTGGQATALNAARQAYVGY